jgi:hypothetical protein
MDSFLSTFRQQAINEKIAKGDTVIVTGRDEYKGWVGIVVATEEVSGESVYTVELQADSKRIERFASNLRKEFSLSTTTK